MKLRCAEEMELSFAKRIWTQDNIIPGGICSSAKRIWTEDNIIHGTILAGEANKTWISLHGV